MSAAFLRRLFGLTGFLVGVAVAQVSSEPSSGFRPVGTISQLMIDVIYPYSDAIFYVERNPPKNDQEWNLLRGKALALAESGNLLMMPSRARDQKDWIKDAQLLVDAGREAYVASEKKNLEALIAVNDHLEKACVQCHAQYRAKYRRRQ
jgi:hypothetical protein